MTKAFTKGQEVTYIASWDDKGSVFYRHAVVYSCGKKQMVLTDAVTGAEMGRNFKPEVGTTETRWEGNCVYSAGGTFPRVYGEELQALCLKIAEASLHQQRDHFARSLSGGWGESYDAVIRKQIAELHEPRVVDYHNR